MTSLTRLLAILATATLVFAGCQRDRDAEPDEMTPKVVEPAGTAAPAAAPGATAAPAATDPMDDTETAAEEEREVLDVDVEANGEALGAELDEERRQFVTATERRMGEIEAGLRELRAEAAAAGSAASAELEDEIADLEREYQELDASLERADETAEDEWNEFERDVSSAMDDLERNYNDALESMKAD